MREQQHPPIKGLKKEKLFLKKYSITTIFAKKNFKTLSLQAINSFKNGKNASLNHFLERSYKKS